MNINKEQKEELHLQWLSEMNYYIVIYFSLTQAFIFSYELVGSLYADNFIGRVKERFPGYILTTIIGLVVWFKLNKYFRFMLLL